MTARPPRRRFPQVAIAIYAVAAAVNLLVFAVTLRPEELIIAVMFVLQIQNTRLLQRWETTCDNWQTTCERWRTLYNESRSSG